MSWNPVHDLQTSARIHRPGQKAKCVYIYRLVCTGTVDEWIWERQERKISVSRFVLCDDPVDDRPADNNDNNNHLNNSQSALATSRSSSEINDHSCDGVLDGLFENGDGCLMHYRSGCGCKGNLPLDSASLLPLDQTYHICVPPSSSLDRVGESFDNALANPSLSNYISFIYARKNSAT